MEPKHPCDLYQKKACSECAEYPRFGCEDLRAAYDAGKKEAFGKMSGVRLLAFTCCYGDMYAVWNEATASENDARTALLFYPLKQDPRILFISQYTWKCVFGEPKDVPLSESEKADPFSRVKVANKLFYYGPASTVPEAGTIIEVVRPSDSCVNGKIIINVHGNIIEGTFNDIGKKLFFSELEIYNKQEVANE
ncbi:MAG: hypothetical protein II038_11035 [Lachnospiraceae bacterium]|nr:hypothetical protein [Lachnospiraceae bacterium]